MAPKGQKVVAQIPSKPFPLTPMSKLPVVKDGAQLMEKRPTPPAIAKGTNAMTMGSLTQMLGLFTNKIFACLLFVRKIIDLPGGQINDPSLGRVLLSFVTSINSLVSVSDL